jgi:hypothetical protein
MQSCCCGFQQHLGRWAVFFGSFSPRGVRSKGDQQPDGQVAHNQKLLNIFGVDMKILATGVQSARKTRKCMWLPDDLSNCVKSSAAWHLAFEEIYSGNWGWTPLDIEAFFPENLSAETGTALNPFWESPDLALHLHHH